MSDKQDYKETAREAHESAHKDVRHHLHELRRLLEQALEHLDAIVDDVQVNTIADTVLGRDE